jgi:hypothetical protein
MLTASAPWKATSTGHAGYRAERDPAIVLDPHVLGPGLLQSHPLDHRVLDPQRRSPYPGSAHAIPYMIVPVRDKPGTLSKGTACAQNDHALHPRERQ